MFAAGERARGFLRAGWAAGLVAAVMHLFAEANGAATIALVAKPVPALLLAAAVFRSGRSALRLPVFAGLLASAVGDVLIQRPGGFLSGLAAFLVAHVCYVSGFWRARRDALWLRALPVALFGAFMASRLAGGLAAAGLPVRIGVIVYILAICTMLWRAAALVGAPGFDRSVGRLALGGAIVFAASDSLIAIHRFVEPLSWSDVPIMVLYWAGQLGIAGAAMAATRSASGAPAPAR